MILDAFSWIIIILIFIVFSIIIFLAFKGFLEFQYTFISSTCLIGFILLLGIIQSDSTSLPIWIQTGATLMLLVITGMSTFAAIEMAKANQQLVQITQNQALLQIKELKRNLIIEVSRKFIQSIQACLKREKQFLESGFFITLYGVYRREGKNENIHNNRPSEILKNDNLIPDTILQKYLEQIHQLNKKFDDYVKNLELLLQKIYEKKEMFIGEFNIYCTTLPNPDKTMARVIIEDKEDAIFVMALADSNHEEYTKYPFFNHNREVLISKLCDMGLEQEIMEYKKITKTFSEIEQEYQMLFNKLYRDWKEEYSVTDAELGLDFNGM